MAFVSENLEDLIGEAVAQQEAMGKATAVTRDLGIVIAHFENEFKHGRYFKEDHEMATLVTGLFKARSSAERAVEDLVAHGWSRDDISLLMSDATHGREFGLAMATKAPEGAATGGTIGGVIGAVAAGLVATGVLVVPGLALLAAGPIVATLAGLGAGAAAGGVTGALIGAGIPEHEARFFNEQLEHGGILVGVYTHSDRANEARKILEASGADKVR